MGSFKIGDVVARRSYGQDVFFKVVAITNTGKEDIITLKGISYRIEADAPESDLVLQNESAVDDYSRKSFRVADKKYNDIVMSSNQKTRSPYRRTKKVSMRETSKENANKFSKPAKVLHIDGDNDYLEVCMAQYKKFGLDVVGKYIPEKEQARSIYKLLSENNPDILVLTGHDGVIKGDGNFSNISNYKNTKYYIDAVNEARRYNKDLDSLVIFAGACQSLYKEIISAGANYASAPNRVLIHALDPVFICQKIAYAGIDRIIQPMDIIDVTITGKDGIGGIQTRGKYRDGFPKDQY